VKKCPKCQNSYDYSSFTRDKSRKDGFSCYCKPCEKAKLADYYVKNTSKINARNIANHYANREQALQRGKRWRKNNPDYAKNSAQIKAQVRKRDAWKMGNGIFKVTKKELQRLYNSPCAYCGSTNKIEIDHVIPLVKGGTHSIGNLTSACRTCNASKNKDFLTVWKKKNIERPRDGY
jgi:5-methylcytosine-specific restriction endonuclease McrA